MTPLTPPSTYTGPLPFATEVRIVEPGTIVTHPVTGETVTVEDGCVATCGQIMFLTPTIAGALKDHPQVKGLL